jgi:hypothetical protein
MSLILTKNKDDNTNPAGFSCWAFFIFGGMPMEKSKEEFVGKTVMEESGTQYFVVGKYKIKVSEHFPERGKTIDNLLEDAVHRAAS